MNGRKIELLSPAKNLEIGIAAINHGADAVYIGPASFGARAAAANSIEDLKRLAEYAHQFRCKVYATVNTILFDHELREAEKLIKSLYAAQVDALIVQDMSVLRLDIPPIQLHASTQCDTRTPEKAKFLQDVGFSQIVLARELMINEIREICNKVDVPIEVFVHGALCVSYSGRCHASFGSCGRSANRGECAQICRWSYNLIDGKGNTVERDKYLLSLRDFNASDRIGDLLAAGASSFKIEGRLKDISYVKNVTAYYRQLLDKHIENSNGSLIRSSVGRSQFSFEPNLSKSFNRGFSHYFLDKRSPASLASLHTPKSLGEPIYDHSTLNNGDGVSFFTSQGKYQGVRVNKVENGRIITFEKSKIPYRVELYRTFDNKWQKIMAGQTSKRTIDVEIEIDENRLVAHDERNCTVAVSLTDVPKDIARNPFNPTPILSKTGDTLYNVTKVRNNLDDNTFIPASALAAKRRKLLYLLDIDARATYKFQYRVKENLNVEFPLSTEPNQLRCDYRENISNHKAAKFYKQHGVQNIELALETNSKTDIPPGTVLMTCRYCVLRELGKCKKHTAINNQIKEPITITSGKNSFRLRFNCAKCEMEVIKN